MDNIAQQYAAQVIPYLTPYVDKKGKEKQKYAGTRADKETRYAHFKIHKNSIS